MGPTGSVDRCVLFLPSRYDESVAPPESVALRISEDVAMGIMIDLDAPARIGSPAEWSVDAACRNSDPDALFVQGAAQNRAKVICRSCPVRIACLADALDNRVEFGVWGGMTERERRALLRRRPNVTSWHRLLETAARNHEVPSAAAV
jgi:WhiB family redox-sensing transcriptional regulator